jgi:hypothetical protein
MSEKIDYAVIGAMAASIYGVVRASIDANAVLSLGPQKQSYLEKQFKAAGFQTELRHGDADDPIPALLQLKDQFDNRVDLLLGLRGLEPDAFARAVEIQFQGLALRVIGREDFIAMKAFAGGPQDLADAQSAITTRNCCDAWHSAMAAPPPSRWSCCCASPNRYCATTRSARFSRESARQRA